MPLSSAYREEDQRPDGEMQEARFSPTSTSPLSEAQRQQAEVVAAFLAAVQANNPRVLRRLCTPTVINYPSSSGFFASPAGPSRGREAVVAALVARRLRYSAMRLEVQSITPRPNGLAIEYLCCWQPTQGTWQMQIDTLLVELVAGQIQQLGVPPQPTPKS